MNAVRYLTPKGIPVVAFDFSGCGYSDGKYITLGLKEQLDLKSVLDSLKSKFQFKRFVLWGRSMGAITSILFMSKYRGSSIEGLVLDSPLSSLEELVILHI